MGTNLQPLNNLLQDDGVESIDIDRTEARLIIDEALAQLNDDERGLIQLRFFEQRSQSEIAEDLGTSQMQVSRVLSKLLVKMRTIIGEPERLAQSVMRR